MPTRHIPEPWQRRIVQFLAIAPVVALVAFVLVAVLWASGWSNRLVAIGLAFEIAGVMAVLYRTIPEEHQMQFGMVGAEADRWTKPGYLAASFLLPVGFVLQFISVVFL